MLSNEWKIPFNVAIGLHVLIILGALYLPGFFKAKPRFADIYTVSLINIAEPKVGSAPAVKKQSTPPPAVVAPKPPVKVQKTVPIATKQQNVAPVQPKITPAPQKSISLKPLKKKIVQETKQPDNKDRRQEIEKINRKRLAEALREEELLAEKAKLAQDALEAERKLLQSQPLPDSLPTTSSIVSGNQTSTNSSAGGSSSSLIESQYLASIRNRLDQFWALPDYLQQDPNLTAIVVITINMDGKIANMLFENKSGNRVYDQFVIKTLEAADPMPPIPAAMKKQRFEIGLVFKPGSIQ